MVLEWTVKVPSYRSDLDRPIDLVEEVLRIYGTGARAAALCSGPALVDGDDDPIVVFNRKVTDYLVGQRFHEVVNYTLRSQKELVTWVSQAASEELALSNPFVDDQSHLRPTLVLGMLESLKLNQSRGVPAAQLCETGRVFMEINGTVQECVGAAFLLCHNPKDRSWLARPEPDFYGVKRHMEIIAGEAGIDLAREELVPVRGAFWGWQEGQSAAAGEMKHGWTARFGLVNFSMARSLGIEGKSMGRYVCDFAVEAKRRPTAHPRYQPFGLFPAALRDLALVVDGARHAEEVRLALDEGRLRSVIGPIGFLLEAVEVVRRLPRQRSGRWEKSLALLAFVPGA